LDLTFKGIIFPFNIMSSKKRDIPTYSPIIETHFHLDMLKALSHQEILELSIKHNIEKFITISVSKNNLDHVVDLSEQFAQVYSSQGLHPHEGDEWSIDAKNIILNNLKTRPQKIVAIGEIGLDYYYTKSPLEDQKKAFEEQLQLAVDFNLPVIIHTRDADEDTKAILKNFSTHLKRKGVVHSFTSGLPLAEFVLNEGFHLGFNGIITFKNAENVRDALRLAPIDRILLETDAPFLTPDPYRGHENAPYYLPFIAEKIAQVKNLELNIVLDQIYQNTTALFKFN
jgi:TatD DNase family protein